jgi:hypothetical protein
MEIIDNFLQQDDFDTIASTIMSKGFPWYHQDDVAYKDEVKEDMTFYSTHWLYKDDKPRFDTSLELIMPILKRLGSMNDNYKLRTLVRVKLNSYPNQNKFIEHPWHEDFEPNTLPYKACLLSLNTCDGYTKFKDGTKIESVSNRAILFDPCISHHSTNTTNQTRRINININYL